MAERVNEKQRCLSSELILNVKKKQPKFKAGAELSSSVNLVDVGYSMEQTDDSYILDLSLHLKNVACPDAVK